MKYPVYLLLLANVAYLGWNIHLQQTSAEVVRELPPLPAGAAPLVTLQELRRQQGTGMEKGQGGQHAEESAHEEDVLGVKMLTELQPPGAGIPVSCQSIGPFLAIEALRATTDELQRLGITARQRSSELQQTNGYWVYLPAMERKQVLQVVKQLEEKGDREYYVGKGNFVALGTFRERERAQIRLEKLRQFGFDPVLEARYETRTEYWLDIDPQAPPADGLDSIIAEHPELQLRQSACP